MASQYHAYSAAKELDDLEVHHSWNEVINTASFELGEAGVADRYRNGLAAFLCAAYIERQPILLVGPNSIDISKALCAAIAGHKHGMLSCEGSYSSHVLQELGHDGEDIVIINNLFASGWMNRLPEILSKRIFSMLLPIPTQRIFKLSLKACMVLCCHCSQSFCGQ